MICPWSRPRLGPKGEEPAPPECVFNFFFLLLSHSFCQRALAKGLCAFSFILSETQVSGRPRDRLAHDDREHGHRPHRRRLGPAIFSAQRLRACVAPAFFDTHKSASLSPSLLSLLQSVGASRQRTLAHSASSVERKQVPPPLFSLSLSRRVYAAQVGAAVRRVRRAAARARRGAARPLLLKGQDPARTRHQDTSAELGVVPEHPTPRCRNRNTRTPAETHTIARARCRRKPRGSLSGAGTTTSAIRARVRTWRRSANAKVRRPYHSIDRGFYVRCLRVKRD